MKGRNDESPHALGLRDRADAVARGCRRGLVVALKPRIALTWGPNDRHGPLNFPVPFRAQQRKGGRRASRSKSAKKLAERHRLPT